jgi:hypothetical protein
MEARDIRKKFLEDNAEFVLDEVRTVLRGEGDYKHKSQDLFDTVFDMIRKIIEKTDEIQSIQAKNTTDVIRLLTQGKITPKEAYQLINMLKTKIDMRKEKLKVDELTTKVRTQKQLLRMIK